MQGNVSANSQYSLVFELTSPYLVQLTGGPYGYTNSQYGYFYGSFDAEVQLTGPGVQFDQTFSFPFDTFVDEVFTLAPGQYTLAAVSGLNDSDSYYLDADSLVQVSLNASFTPIPEPARVSMVLGVLMVIGIFFARRHGQNRLSV